jgi:hypothetical protein
LLCPVRYWPIADIASCTAHVRFRGESGHDLLRRECPLLTQSGHRQKGQAYQPELARPGSRTTARLDASIVRCLLRRCFSLILAEGCNANIWSGVIGKPQTSYCGVCWAVAALVPFRMTTAAVKAAAITIKIAFSWIALVFGLDIFRTRILVFLGSATFALLSPKARNRIHGAIVLITRATPRVAAKIEILSLHID